MTYVNTAVHKLPPENVYPKYPKINDRMIVPSGNGLIIMNRATAKISK
jgi:hypothetical protein